MQARLHATEGTSDVTIQGNSFINSSFYADQTTDVFISHNTFSNGIVSVGDDYGATTGYFDLNVPADQSFLSFASQNLISVDNNVFSTDSTYTPPGIIRVGDFTTASITNNILTYAASNAIGAITTFSGVITSNVINITQANAADGIVLVPDNSTLGGPSNFSVQGNTVNAQYVWASTLIVDPGFVDGVPICIQNNNWNTIGGTPVLATAGSVTLSCSQ